MFTAAQNTFADDAPQSEVQQNTGQNKDLTAYYDSELFKWEYNAFNGFSLNYQNQTSSIVFGINKNFAGLLKQYPDTEQYYESYRKKNITGNIMLFGGLTVVTGSFILPLFLLDADDEAYLKVLTVSLGGFLVGLTVEIIGAYIIPLAYENLFNGINLFNRKKIAEFGAKPAL